MPTLHFSVSITAGKRTPARVSVHWSGKPRDLTLINGATLTASRACEMVRSELQNALNGREEVKNEMGAADVWPMQLGSGQPIRRRKD